ncbi:MAG: metallophosphoesterase family protein [Sphaerochaeta sp.]|jgi:predicted phosphodiesterase|nr:metallophosphoesterase family protein [Sphaerochaeta sp.]
MSAKSIDLKTLPDMLAEGPTGREKLEKQAKVISDLSDALDLMARRQRPYEVPVRGKDNMIRFGLIGDTHFGSLYQRADALAAYYDACEREGVTDVLHAGDVLAGWRVYKGQEFELHPNGRSWPEQRDMFASLAPLKKGITTHFITGNHDASYKKLIGLVAGPDLEAARSDWKFVGQDVGDVTLKARNGLSFHVRLVHPGGGTSYAVSYRMQKMIESISGGRKPDMLASGHYHKAETLPSYRNVFGVDVGCFEDQTPFMASRASAAHVGGWIVTVSLNDRSKLTARVQTEWIGFFEPTE